MTPRPNNARPKCEPLELREAPASVSQLTEYRPLDFQIDGNVETTDVHPYAKAAGPATDSFSGSFTATGRITYDANGGQSGTVKYTATGDGTSEYITTAQTEDGNPNITVDYHATETGNLTFRDSNGTWTTTGSFTRTSNRSFNNTTATEKVTLGPTGVKLNFDPSTMTVSGGWASQSGTSASSGSLIGCVTQPGAAATDLSVSSVNLQITDEGYQAKFSVGVAGALMTPPDEASPAAIAKVQWTDGTGRIEDANAIVNVAWNAGKVSADVAGLEAPDWATGLKVVVEANGWSETATLANNAAAADLGSAETPGDPTTPPPPPAPNPSARIAVLGQSGPAIVNVYGESGDFKFALTPYGDNWQGGMSVAVGDLTGDGVTDIVTGAGAGGGPHVKVFDGVTGKQVGNFFAFDSSFGGGVNVATGDVDNDGGLDIIVGAGMRGGPHVKVFDGQSGDLLRSFFAFDENSRSGVNVAAADFNNDGIAEIVTGSGAGEVPAIRVFGPADAPQSSFAPYSNNFRTGAIVNTRKLADGRIVIVASVDVIYGLPERQFDATGKEIV